MSDKRYRFIVRRMLLLSLANTLLILFVVNPILWAANGHKPVPALLTLVVFVAIAFITARAFSSWYIEEVTDDKDGDDHDGAIPG